MKKSSAALVFVVAALAFLAATPSAARSDLTDLLAAAEKLEEVESLIEGKTTLPLPLQCCNKCGRCDRRVPELARCVCNDVFLVCPPLCKRCEQVPSPFWPQRFYCADMSYKACHRKCPEPALQAIIN